MERKILLGGNFYKGNMHCHSTLSDGKQTPEELKELFKAKGYSFLAITDHECIYRHPELDDENFITITSSEIAIKEFPEQSTLKNWDMKVCHLNLYAKERNNDVNVCYDPLLDHYSAPETRASVKKLGGNFRRAYDADGINEIIRTANENGFFVCYNHPRWSLENYGDYGKYKGLWGVEVYNTSVNLDGIYEYDINVADDFHRDGKRVFVSCGDDNHSSSASCGAFVMVNTDELTYEKIVDGLLKGNFYTSTKPIINELYFEDGKVHINCSPAKRISYSTRGRRAESINAADGEFVCGGSFGVTDADAYFRIGIVDGEGNRADTQCYYIEDLKKL